MIAAGILLFLLGALLLVLVLRLLLSMLGLLLMLRLLLSVLGLLLMLRLLLSVLGLLLMLRLLLSMLGLLLMLRLLLSVLGLLLMLRLLLRMLRFRSCLLVLSLAFVLLRVAKSSCSENHAQERCCAGTSQSFHRLCLTIQRRAWQRSSSCLVLTSSRTGGWNVNLSRTRPARLCTAP